MNSNTGPDTKERDKTSHVDDIGLAAAMALPASSANEKLVFRDIWDNRRVLLFCKTLSFPPPWQSPD